METIKLFLPYIEHFCGFDFLHFQVFRSEKRRPAGRDRDGVSHAVWYDALTLMDFVRDEGGEA